MDRFPFASMRETDFRECYRFVQERVCACFTRMSEHDACPNECRYLIADEIDELDELPIHGINCEARFLGWNGKDIESSAVEVYCRVCAAERERDRLKQEFREQAEYQQRCEMEERRLLVEEKRKRTMRDFWANLSALDFERQCAHLLTQMGFEAQATPLTNDGAFDVILHKNGTSGAAQCKAWTKPCGVNLLREFYGALQAGGMTFGYFIAKNGLTLSARLQLQKMPQLQCWTIDDLVQNAIRSSESL